MALPVVGNLSGLLNLQTESYLAQRLPEPLVEAIPTLLGPVAEVLIREDDGGFFLAPTPVDPQERSRLAKVPRHRVRHALAQPVRRLLTVQLKAQTPRAGLLHSIARHHPGKLRPLRLQRLVQGRGSQD